MTRGTFHFYDLSAEGAANSVSSSYASSYTLLRLSREPIMHSVTRTSSSSIGKKSPSPTLSDIPTRSPPFQPCYFRICEEAYHLDHQETFQDGGDYHGRP